MLNLALLIFTPLRDRDHKQYSPDVTVKLFPFTCAVAVTVENSGPRINTGAGCVQVATFPLSDTHGSPSDHWTPLRGRTHTAVAVGEERRK